MATEGVRMSAHSWVTRGSAGCLGQSHLRELLPSSRLATTDTLGRLLGTGTGQRPVDKGLRFWVQGLVKRQVRKGT
jgi:hypothetical protein